MPRVKSSLTSLAAKGQVAISEFQLWHLIDQVVCAEAGKEAVPSLLYIWSIVAPPLLQSPFCIVGQPPHPAAVRALFFSTLFFHLKWSVGANLRFAFNAAFLSCVFAASLHFVHTEVELFLGSRVLRALF